MKLDGSRQFSSTMLYSGSVLSIGTNCSFSRDQSFQLVAGLNAPIFSIGHLGDSGLAAEVRNPEAGGLSRLQERTFFRADLRSESLSRIGIALMFWDARTGVVWERREEIDAGIIWVVPISNETWNLELLGEAGLFRNRINDESWYPDYPWRPEGAFTLISGRLRHFKPGETRGITGILSGGIHLKPGWFSALSYVYSSGPWRLRSRGVYSSEYFRNADGESLDIPLEISFDCRYRPVKGLQLTLDYQSGVKKLHTESRSFSDEGSAAIGWRFGEVQISIESDWRRIFEGKDIVEIPACKRIKGRIIWDHNFLHLGVLGGLEPREGWTLRFEGAFPSHGAWLLEPYLELHNPGNIMLIDVRLKGRWDIGRNRLIFSVFAGDFGRDWDAGPKTKGDFEVEIRWIRKFK
ncbi:MAG: hypothetical protein KAH21_02390 [Spirochaetaceae bacterium]|nr:hypothetical protein [Spirochaetaceae bacterium]